MSFNPPGGPPIETLDEGVSLTTRTTSINYVGSGVTATAAGNATTANIPGGGSGTVTDVSVVTANGFAGSVATSTTTPAITLSTTITGFLQGNGTAISAASTTGSGSTLVLSTSPVLVTPTLGVATATSVNGLTITSTTGGTLTIANSSSLITSGAFPITLTSTGSTNVTLPTTGTLATLAGSEVLTNKTINGSDNTITNVSLATGVTGNLPVTNLNSGTSASSSTFWRGDGVWATPAGGGDVSGPASATDGVPALFDGTTGKLLKNSTPTGSGNPVMQTSPTLTTPVLGVATATSINKVAITAPATSATLTIADGKTLSVAKSLTLDGTDGTTMTFPTTSATIARTDAANAFTGASTASAWVLTSPTITTSIVPTSNDGAALGSTSNQFSDLFLASGAVINFANGNSVITHSSAVLEVTTGDLRVTTAGTNSASVVTVGGTQTLTGKTLTSPTLTTPSAFTTGGTITLAENTSIALDPAGSADGKYTGITVTGTAGYTQAFGDLVYLDPTDSRWEATDANSAAGADGDARGILGMVVSAGTDGNPCTILLQGIIRADAKFPTFTVNNPIYVSETSGLVTQTQPTTTDVVIRIVGAALTADEMYFNPDNTWITHT